MKTAQSTLEPLDGQWSLRGGRWVCVTSIWETENVGNSWKKSSAVLQILRGKSQPAPDVDMVDCEHMKCCGFNSCSQSAFFFFFLTLWQLPGEKHIFTSRGRWDGGSSWVALPTVSVSLLKEKCYCFISFLMGWDRNSVILKILIFQHLISILLIKQK